MEITIARSDLAYSTRGVSITFLLRASPAAPIMYGTIFFNECPDGDGVETLQDAINYLSSNVVWVKAQLAASSGLGLDGGKPVSNGWKHRTNPERIKRANQIEAIMLKRARQFTQWGQIGETDLA